MISINRTKVQNLDKWLIAAVCVLTVFGIVCIGSALHINVESDSRYMSQIMYFITGLVIMFSIAFLDLDYMSRFYKVLYVLNIVLLVAVILFGHHVLFCHKAKTVSLRLFGIIHAIDLRYANFTNRISQL